MKKHSIHTVHHLTKHESCHMKSHRDTANPRWPPKFPKNGVFLEKLLNREHMITTQRTN